MMKMERGLMILICALVLLSCEKTINIQPDAQTPKLVVDGQIENGQPPVISLSTSLDYFSELDASKLTASFVHNATVNINDGARNYPLREYSVVVNGVTFYYYSTDQLSSAGALFGVEGKTYTLTIGSGGQTYTAVTSVPIITKRIDSIWWKPAPFQTDSTKVVLMARVTDPPGLGNYIRYYTRVNREDFYPGFNSVYDDQIIDGKTYDVQLDQGVSKNNKAMREDYAYFHRGDTVTVKHSNIDKGTYTFWRTWEFTYQSVGNPFSSPGKVIGNVSNGALGAFCGYASQYKALIIPK